MGVVVRRFAGLSHVNTRKDYKSLRSPSAMGLSIESFRKWFGGGEEEEAKAEIMDFIDMVMVLQSRCRGQKVHFLMISGRGTDTFTMLSQ